MTSTAYLLISHGSRDPRHQVAINRLAQLVRERLGHGHTLGPLSSRSLPPLLTNSHTSAMAVLGIQDSPNKDGILGSVLTAAPVVQPVSKQVRRQPQDRYIVGTAVLDFGLLPLHEQIHEFGRRLRSAGIRRLQLIPLFLLSGKHVMEDIPAEVELARELLQGTIDVVLGDHIGGQSAMPELIEKRFMQSPNTGRLIVAHGSRRAKGNRTIDTLAKSLGTAVAYWTNESDIENQTIQLMQQGCSKLTIFPYFLFAGGITDAVAHLTEELAERFPRTSFRLLPPLGATADVANLIMESLGHGSSSNHAAQAESYVL